MTPSSLTIIDYLTEDHERLHALLEQATAGERFEEQAFARFREGLLRHIAIEEKLLLPAVRAARNGTPPSRWGELRTEHAALTSLLVPVPDLALCREIAALLGEHDAKEEGESGVYAECARALTLEASEVLGRSAAGYPTVPVAPHAAHGYRTAASALEAVRRKPSAP